ncbi:MAG TPA: PqqD family protein [Clostridia bacterium]|nr:PqqD family protein [Clostridia bacterium]
MKAKKDFILRKVAGSYIIVATGRAAIDFTKVINLNETGAFLWSMLEKGVTKDEMVKNLLQEYNVSEEKATEDINVFIEKVKQEDMLE